MTRSVKYILFGFSFVAMWAYFAMVLGWFMEGSVLFAWWSGFSCALSISSFLSGLSAWAIEVEINREWKQ